MKDKRDYRFHHNSNNYKKSSKSWWKNRPDMRGRKSHQTVPQPHTDKSPVIHEFPKSLCALIQDIRLYDESSNEMPQLRIPSSPSELNNKNKYSFIDASTDSLPSSPNADPEKEILNSSTCPGSENEILSSARLPFFGSSTHPNDEHETLNCETADGIVNSNDVVTVFRQELNLNTMNDEGSRTSQRQEAEAGPFCVENPSPDKKTPTSDLTDEQLRMLFDGDEDGDNLLHLSIIHDKEDTARRIIEAAPDVTFLNRCNTLCQTPLHIAVVIGNSRMVRRLICAGAQVDLPEERGYTALHLACGLGHLDIVKQLTTAIAFEETLDNNYQIPIQRIPQDLELRNRQGLTCLHLAVIHGRPEIVSLLLQIGADVNAAHGKTGRSVLHSVADNGNVEMLALLLKDKSVKVDLPDFDGLTPFQVALREGHHEIQRLLILNGAAIRNLPRPEEYEEIIIDLSAKPRF